MSKEETIQAIRNHNRSVGSEYLLNFDQQQLEMYLRRLETVKGRRGRSSVWVRESATPAVVTRRG